MVTYTIDGECGELTSAAATQWLAHGSTVEVMVLPEGTEVGEYAAHVEQIGGDEVPVQYLVGDADPYNIGPFDSAARALFEAVRWLVHEIERVEALRAVNE